MTAAIARIKTSYPRPSTTAANDDDDNRPTASTGALAVVVVAFPFVLVGLVALGVYLFGN